MFDKKAATVGGAPSAANGGGFMVIGVRPLMRTNAKLTANRDRRARGLWPMIGWACFLGCSWTWVIGMVWPAMLLRDYGLWGWVAFAVPNVLGAMAMGFVLAKPGRSRHLVEQHGWMARRFSECTVAFHLFVLGWLMSAMFTPGIVLFALILAIIISVRGNRTILQVAVLVTIVSLLGLGIGLTFGRAEAWIDLVNPPSQGFPLGLDDLLWFTPGLIFGFALCPYLDLTFHRARQHTETRTGMASFALGFGGVFLAMIVGTLAYSALLWPLAAYDRIQPSLLWMAVLFIYFTVQIAFTTGLHLRELSDRPEKRWIIPVVRITLIAISALVLGFLAPQEQAIIQTEASPLAPRLIRPFGEMIYRIFLLAYAVIFPAYVWLCVIPTVRPTARYHRWIIYLITVIVVLPIGFVVLVLGNTFWTLPALSLLIVARLAVEACAGLKRDTARDKPWEDEADTSRNRNSTGAIQGLNYGNGACDEKPAIVQGRDSGDHQPGEG